MDITFIGDRDKFVVIYVDDLIGFSNSDVEHLVHLKKKISKVKKVGFVPKPLKIIVFHAGR
jgi:hypothetical protein